MEEEDEPVSFLYDQHLLLKRLIRDVYPDIAEPVLELSASILNGLYGEGVGAAPRYVLVRQAVATAKMTLGL